MNSGCLAPEYNYVWPVNRAQEQRGRKAPSGQGWLRADWRALLKGEGVDRAECFTLWGLSNSLQTICRRALVEVAPHLPFVDLGVVTLASPSLSCLD